MNTRPPVAPARSVIAGILGLLAAVPTAHAGIVASWINASGGLFEVPANWSPTAPGPTDLALFDLDAAFTIDVNDPAIVSRVVVRRGQATFVLAAPLTALSSTVLAPSIVVGDTGGAAPSLAVTDGTLAGTFMEVANAPGAAGDVLVDATATIELEQTLSIGPRGAGAVASSGAIHCRQLVLGGLAAGSGVVVISGADATLGCDDALVVGQFGDGVLEIADGAAATFGEGILAVDGFATGSAIVRGAGTSVVVEGDLEIARRNIGTFEVRDGATVTVGGATFIGVSLGGVFFPPFYPPGDGTLVVAGPGSRFVALGDFRAPVQGQSHLRVEDGGVLEATACGVCGMFGLVEIVVGPGTSADEPAIAFAGDAYLSGTHTVALLDGFVPAAGAVYPLLTAPKVDVHSSFALPALPPPLTWHWNIEASGLGMMFVVTVASLADLDGDGKIAGADLGLLLGAWGPGQPGAAGDLDANGVVDGSDLGLLLGAWQ